MSMKNIMGLGSVDLLITIAVTAGVAVLTIPMILAYFVNFSNIDGFIFADFFKSGGIASLIISAGLVVGIFALLGMKIAMGKGGNR